MDSRDDITPTEEPVPPTAEQVALRAMVLAAVSARALLEQDDPSNPEIEATRDEIIACVENIKARDAFETNEWEFLSMGDKGTAPYLVFPAGSMGDRWACLRIGFVGRVVPGGTFIFGHAGPQH